MDDRMVTIDVSFIDSYMNEAKELRQRAEAAEAGNKGLSSLLDALGEMSKKYDVMFYPSVRYWEVARWIKAAQKGATFSVAGKDGSKLLVWDKEGKEQDDDN